MRTLTIALGLALLSGCVAEDLDIEDGANDAFPSGKADGGLEEGSPEARGVLAVVNAADLVELDVAAGLSARAARNIVDGRDADGYGTLAELDAVPYVGPATLQQLLAYAEETGRVIPLPSIDVVFSPQPAASAHTRRVAALIRGAERSIDIAMYSMSDAEISTALADAVDRGVDVRFLFETAAEDRKLPVADRPGTKSGRLERDGVDVRWVNKILHHKVAIIDGPRDDAAAAGAATIATGSANWSYGGGQVYDENTLFIAHAPALAAAYQREFDLLWEHAADFTLGAATAGERSTADLDGIAADPDAGALFTSANYTVAEGSTTFRIDRKKTTVSDALVAAIEGADASIHIASGHLRLRPVAEALIARKAARPDLDVRVYLDQQEFISASGHAAQLDELEDCLAAATTETQRWNCSARDFLFGKQIGDAGVPVRYKTYAYRWDYSYAVQMHHKFVVIDGDELFTGSYNLSMNAEQATFENLVHLRGDAHAGVIAAFEAEFERLWGTGRAPDLLPGLRDTVDTASTIPLVFPSMALTWQELSDLKALIRRECPAVDSTEYRDDLAGHRTCPR